MPRTTLVTSERESEAGHSCLVAFHYDAVVFYARDCVVCLSIACALKKMQ